MRFNSALVIFRAAFMHDIYCERARDSLWNVEKLASALDTESMPDSMIKPAPPPVRFVDFMMRVAFEQVLPYKSIAEASDSRKTRREYRKNAIISSHCLKFPRCR